ncbi:TetR/AcrR family transcriptional regulator [Nonomuraea sp. NPDC050310]|uniref:TetR/AcrR family transcriptional regulator n=1 Tax=Nonomuraea sp. NPDC050310 TaxID=3154935 RepID=UPI0034115C19
MQISRRTQADRTAATRTALIAAGRRLFAEHGFAGVGTEAIVRDAAVSRGALYHHFGDKTELFAAVLADVEGEVTTQLAAAVDAEADFVTLMMASLRAWLDACQRPEVRRIVLIDGPSVLGWARWRDICQPHILGLIEHVLAQGMRDGTLSPLPARPLAHLLLAVADEAALYISAAPDPTAARQDMETTIRPLVEALIHH